MQGKGTSTLGAHSTKTSAARCAAPARESIISVPFNDDDDGSQGTGFGHLSKGNYVACFGGNTMLNAVPGESTNPMNPEPRYAGIFGMVRIQKYPIGARLGKGTPPAKVTDGMSNTVMLSEILTWNEVNETGGSGDDGVRQGNDDWRGVWMIPSVGASAFTGKFPPNSKGEGPDFRGGQMSDSLRTRYRPAARESKRPATSSTFPVTKIRKRPTSGPRPAVATTKASTPRWATARSRFISDDIDARVWHAMCTRAGEDVVNQ